MDHFGLKDVLPIPARLPVSTASASQWASAQGLVTRRYAERGYVCKDLSTHAEEGAVVVCSAFDGHSTVGTIAVRFDSEQGFNADLVFGPEINELRASGLNLCEFGRLALDHHVADNKALLAHLFHLAYLHAHRLAACEMLVIEVNPRHVAFYRRMLGFKVLAEERLNPRVNAPAVLMCLDLQYAREQIACFGGNAASAVTVRSLYPYFYGAVEEAAMLAKLRQ
ncbi:long-chain N-acyl amino acid synthase [Paucibacter sp. AS339]|uniref:N-acyl amino acid synthase FeeM domain-containing protein n=1 Tax=Paucibacter hankyongi TaxID=3133434 RepID=UPI0030A4F188